MSDNLMTAMVTGAASGLGAATAYALAESGWLVAAVDREGVIHPPREDSITENSLIRRFQADLADPPEVDKLFKKVSEELGSLRALVNCHGIGYEVRTVDQAGVLGSLPDFRRLIDVNLVSLWDVSRHAAGLMTQNEPDNDGCRGVIVNTSSIDAIDGQAGAGYGASKAGVEGMTLPMARELSHFGIRVVTIAPGTMDTPMLRGSKSQDLADFALFPKRFGRPDEFADAAQYVIGNALMNGSTIRLDAGARVSRT